MEPITLFSWGYWGWGNATPQLVQAVDAAEAARGFAPPRFVDVRISRSVRALGFRDKTFESLLGRDRYTWLRGLGNKQVVTHKGPSIQIADPDAADALLDFAIDGAAARQRVIFFCSCEWPIHVDVGECHRVTVGRLVRAAAIRRGVSVRTVEWPGGEVETIELNVPIATIRSVRSGRATVPLGQRIELGRYATLAWGSLVTLRAGEESLLLASGRCLYQGGQWCLPVLERFPCRAAADREPNDWVKRFRRSRGFNADQVESAAAPSLVSPSCVYTIASLEKLELIAANGGRGSLTEQRQWATGRQLLDQARRNGQRMPLLLGDAADCSRLLYSAVLEKIELSAEGTRYSFSELRRLSGRHTPQELVLVSTGKKIAPNFIRPYAICRTPGFLLRSE